MIRKNLVNNVYMINMMIKKELMMVSLPRTASLIPFMLSILRGLENFCHFSLTELKHVERV